MNERDVYSGQIYSQVIQLQSAISAEPNPLDEDEPPLEPPALLCHPDPDSVSEALPGRTSDRMFDWGCVTVGPTYPLIRVRWKPVASQGSRAVACSRQRRRKGWACWNGSARATVGATGVLVVVGRTLRTRTLISSVISSRGSGEPFRHAT